MSVIWINDFQIRPREGQNNWWSKSFFTTLSFLSHCVIKNSIMRPLPFQQHNVCVFKFLCQQTHSGAFSAAASAEKWHVGRLLSMWFSSSKARSLHSISSSLFAFGKGRKDQKNSLKLKSLFKYSHTRSHTHTKSRDNRLEILCEERKQKRASRVLLKSKKKH